MITVYYKKDDHIVCDSTPLALNNINPDDLVWVDVFSPQNAEKNSDSWLSSETDDTDSKGPSETIESPEVSVADPDTDLTSKELQLLVDHNLLSPLQAQEMEGASEFSESLDAVFANPNFFVLKDHALEVEPVSFVITSKGLMVSLRHSEFKAFNHIEKELHTFNPQKTNGFTIFVTLMQSRIDHDAEIVEFVSRQITQLAKDISTKDKIDKSMLYRIIELQEKTMTLRENTFDLQKVISGILRSSSFSREEHEKAELMLKDVNSLISHADFGFQRLDYFQDTALGLINIEQNEITKIFSVAAVIFMPPTLVASVYGMNFKYMPELNWAWTLSNGWIVPAGYLFALFLMVLFTLMTVWFFRYKKWL